MSTLELLAALAEKMTLLAAAAVFAVLLPPLRKRLLGQGGASRDKAFGMLFGTGLSVWGAMLGLEVSGAAGERQRARMNAAVSKMVLAANRRDLDEIVRGRYLDEIGVRGHVAFGFYVDGFGEAYYGRPESFLDPGARLANSAWSFVPDEVAAGYVAHLASDLESGEWDRRYGELRTQPSFDGALRLIVARP